MLGIEDKYLQEGGNDTLTDILNKWGNRIMEEMREQVRNTTHGVDSSKGLEQSIIFMPLEIGKNQFTLVFEAEDYFKFVDQGVQGAKFNRAPRSPFRYKNAPPPLGKKGARTPLFYWAQRNRFNPYALQQSIFQKGIKPKNIIEATLSTQLIEEITQDVLRVLGRGIELSISEGLE